LRRVFVSLVIFVSFLESQVLWYELDDALIKQEKNSKIIMIETYKDNCRYCKLMDKTFEDEELSKWINERFIAVKVDINNYDGDIDLCIKMTPSFFFVDKNKKVIKSFAGSWSKEDFIDLAKNIKGE
jgi:thioredoxin-related protein